MREFKDEFEPRVLGALKEAERCLQCYDPPCAKGCPAGVDVKRFIGLMQKGEYEDAASVVERDNPLGLICGYICPSANTCQKNCISKKLGKAIDIRALQAFTIEEARRQGAFGSRDYDTLRINEGGIIRKKNGDRHGNGRIAVIGAGPAGISASFYLTKFGYEVTLFEQADKLGGRLSLGIPEFRVTPELVMSEVEKILEGVTVKTGVRFGTDVTAAELKEQGFKGIVICTGKFGSKRTALEGTATDGLYDAEDILNGSDWKTKGHKRAVVIGAGNVAVDVARTLTRNGLKEVSICYRGSNSEVKAIQEEREEAYQDNITLQLHAVPFRAEGEDKLTGMTFHRSESDRDEKGRRVLTELPEEYDFTIPCDMAVFAVGYEVEREELEAQGIAMERGVILTHDYETNLPSVYAAGDAMGGKLAVEAAGMGKAAAIALDDHLGEVSAK